MKHLLTLALFLSAMPFHKICFLALSLSFVHSTGYAQKKAPVEVNLYSDTLGYLDPVFLEFGVIPGEGISIGFPPYWRDYFFVQYRHKDSSTWLNVHMDWLDENVYVKPISNGSFQEEAQTTEAVEVGYFQIAPEHNYVAGCYEQTASGKRDMEKHYCFCPGDYQLKVVFKGNESKKRKKRIPGAVLYFDFTVDGYSSPVDEAAAEWIMANKLYIFYFQIEDGPRSRDQNKRTALYRSFLGLFPESKFAPYAHYNYHYFISERSIAGYEEIIRHLEAAQRKTDNPWLKRRVEPELKSMRQVLGGLRSREEWERKQKEKTKNDGNE